VALKNHRKTVEDLMLTSDQEKEALHYDLEALRQHVEKRRANIKIFEGAIQTERDGIELDQRMIAFLEARHVHQV
jgi:hypothetical protein